ncbi:hypothetical protein [Pseudomonas sp. WS 5011]|uniref:hypothetical protein n=1 Tax=Pseudomonas sp. WS 5011 TaxID=2717477 RepID=UPI001472C473|nr:hypothetical protein [Pseudomonas sp. WS 5011]NMY50115.1 hypothetical protein [Pseudomonas sp. WS 5011]
MNNQEQMVYRDTNVITVDQIHQDFLHPERLRLQLSDARVMKAPLDVGSLAYFKRGKNKNSSEVRGIPVVESSLVESRRKLVVSILDSFLKLRNTTIMLRFRLSESVITWLNCNGYVDVFSDAVQASKAFAGYSDYLNGAIIEQSFSPRHASSLQMVLRNFIEWQFPDDYQYVLSSAVFISPARKTIRPPRQSDVQMYKDACLAIARRYSEFVMNNERYPCVVKIRDYEIVKFPSTNGLFSPFKVGANCYSAVNRRVSTVDEYSVFSENRKKSTQQIIYDLDKVQANFDAANKDSRAYDRMQIATLAAKAYAALFILITGASPTEIEQFEYEGALQVGISPLKKELAALKFRAGGKEVKYVVGRKEGRQLLEEYLSFREWVLNGQYCGKLFFTIKYVRREWVFYELNANSAMNNLYSLMSGVYVDAKYPNITSRKVRKHKSSVEHSARFAPVEVAASLNHTEVVNQLSYSEATIEQQESELATYWAAVRHAAKMVQERSENAPQTSVSTAAGHCEVFNAPRPVSGGGAVVIEPNCRTQYGCLYCTHYVCHSDEEDVHKLLSLQYVISAVRDGSSDYSHAEALYKDLSIRIEFILEAIAGRSEAVSKMVEELKAKVFELGILTSFWENRLQRYEQMGVVF